MSRGRTAALVVALITTITVFGACSSGSSKPTTAELDRRSAAAIRADAKRARAVASRKAAAAARRKARLAKAPGAVTTPTSIGTVASTTPSGDLVAIQRTVARLNAAFRASVATGITNSTFANHWVVAGVYSGDQCAAFEAARGRGIVAEELVIHPESLVRTPGWVDPVIGRVPQGRIYRVMVDEIQTLVTTGQRRALTMAIHVTVRPDGNAHLVLRCA
jgi:hypothetical protein